MSAVEKFTPKGCLSIALKAVGVSATFKKSGEEMLVLATILATTESAELRDIAQEAAEKICGQFPKLDRDECYKKILRFLRDLQKKGQKAIARFKKQVKKSARRK